MINQTQIIAIFIIYTSLSLVLYLLKTIMGETKYNQYIKNNIYYIPLVQMFDNILNYDELILFKVILTSIIYMNINLENINIINKDQNPTVIEQEQNGNAILDKNTIFKYYMDFGKYPEGYTPTNDVAVEIAEAIANNNLQKETNVLSPPPKPTPL